jgi:hypothetical protein
MAATGRDLAFPVHQLSQVLALPLPVLVGLHAEKDRPCLASLDHGTFRNTDPSHDGGGVLAKLGEGHGLRSPGHESTSRSNEADPRACVSTGLVT